MERKIVILGAGRSSVYLIEYLQNWCGKSKWELCIADQFPAPHLSSVLNPFTEFRIIEISDPTARKNLFSGATLVVSMLPAFMHPVIAETCLELGIHMATASYESDEMRALKTQIENKGLYFLNECGLDPGLDHMSSMRILDSLRRQGANITGFHSYCGGLVANESIDNPWGYKFSWNPRNVILAGQGTAKFLEDGQLKFLPYHRLFQNIKEIELQTGEIFDGYANRDSLAYQGIYGLNSLKNLTRGTLRHKGFCEAWNIFVQMGITDDSYSFPLETISTYGDFSSAFLPGNGKDLKRRIELLNKDKRYSPMAIEMVLWTGLFSDEPIQIKQGSPAAILQDLLERKWKLNPSDKDRVVMHHIVEYELEGIKRRWISTLDLNGQDQKYTAMAKTVGLPLAIAIRLLLEKKITGKGLLLPVKSDFYQPVLKELEDEFNISFSEEITSSE